MTNWLLAHRDRLAVLALALGLLLAVLSELAR